MAAVNDGCAGAAYGRVYPEKVVLERKGADALVMRDSRGSRYVIAHGFDEESGRWAYGEYFADLLEAALAFFGDGPDPDPDGGGDYPSLEREAAACRAAAEALHLEGQGR